MVSVSCSNNSAVRRCANQTAEGMIAPTARFPSQVNNSILPRESMLAAGQWRWEDWAEQGARGRNNVLGYRERGLLERLAAER